MQEDNGFVLPIPIGDKFIVSVLPDQQVTKGGVLLPEIQKTPRHARHAEVIVTGPGLTLDDGGVLECPVVAGDEVLFLTFKGEEFTYGGKMYYLLSSSDIIGIFDFEDDEEADYIES